MRENQTSNFYKREGSKKELFLIFIGNGQEFHEPGPLAELSLSLSLSHARGGGGHLGIFWVGMCCPGLQIGNPF